MWLRSKVYLASTLFIVAMATMRIPTVIPTKSAEIKDMRENYKESCWPDHSTCANNSAKGSDLRAEKCWLRLV